MPAPVFLLKLFSPSQYIKLVGNEYRMKDVFEYINEYAEKGADFRLRFFEANAHKIKDAAMRTAIAIAMGHKLLICGNGGSAADAQHIAGEFVNRFLIERPALPAIALTTDTSIITAVGNDSSFEQIFSRQIDALGKPGDILLAISTSGKSVNVLNAIAGARQRELLVIGLTRASAPMSSMCDIAIEACGEGTPHIQEQHLAFEHIFCSLTDHFLFENVAAIAPFLQQAKDDKNADI